MKETHTFLAPDYFSAFSCKMGACRAACCQGWPISLSMENYFHLLGMECSAELRRKLDCGMHMADPPSPEQYAQFSPRYDGDCPLRLEDGRCALHADMGEEVLPDICRLYPRGIRVKNEQGEGRYECSCANSCEAVLELFLHRNEPLTFTEKELTFIMPPHPGSMGKWQVNGHDWKIRHRLIRILQNRSLPLAERILCLGKELKALAESLSAKNDSAIEIWIAAEPCVAESKFLTADRSIALELVCRLTKLLGERHRSIEEYAADACANYYETDVPEVQYAAACAKWENTFPDWEIFLEHVLVNHVFFAQFPFRNDQSTDILLQEYEALCGIYALLRFMAVEWYGAHEGEDALIDVWAAVFRMIDHTAFEKYLIPMLRSMGCHHGELLLVV